MPKGTVQDAGVRIKDKLNSNIVCWLQGHQVSVPVSCQDGTAESPNLQFVGRTPKNF